MEERGHPSSSITCSPTPTFPTWDLGPFWADFRAAPGPPHPAGSPQLRPPPSPLPELDSGFLDSFLGGEKQAQASGHLSEQEPELHCSCNASPRR